MRLFTLTQGVHLPEPVRTSRPPAGELRTPHQFHAPFTSAFVLAIQFGLLLFSGRSTRVSLAKYQCHYLLFFDSLPAISACRVPFFVAKRTYLSLPRSPVSRWSSTPFLSRLAFAVRRHYISVASRPGTPVIQAISGSLPPPRSRVKLSLE